MRKPSNSNKRIGPSVKNPGVFLRIGRICFTCQYRTTREGNFIHCKHIGKRRGPVWEKSFCAKWRISTNRKRLSQFERFVDTKDLINNTQYRAWCYKNTITDEKKKIKRPELGLGRCCFLCKFRGAKKRNKVACNKRSGKFLWEKAVCRLFKLTDDWTKLSQYAKYMNKSGVDTKGTQWIK